MIVKSLHDFLWGGKPRVKVVSVKIQVFRAVTWSLEAMLCV